MPNGTASHSTTTDWWRSSEAPTRGAFFPTLLHPVFASTFKNHDPVHLQALSSGKNFQVSAKVHTYK